MNALHTWIWPLSTATDIAGSALRLSSSERERAARFRRAEDHAAYVVAHAGLRVLLAQQLDVAADTLAIEVAPGGKPFLPEAMQLQFNLSHSCGYALLATGAWPLGVDIERHRVLDDLPELLRQVATAEECGDIEALPASQREAAFFRLWVRKEALLKAIGSGLPGGPERLRVGSDAWRDSSWQTLRPDDHDARPWFARQLPAPANHSAAIVVAANALQPPPLHFHSLPAHWLSATACAFAS